MSGLNSYDDKRRKSQRRRNHIAKDLHTEKYGPRIRESKRQHMIDELHRKEMDVSGFDEEDYHFFKELGLGTKE